jgi:hypothetical protein
MYISGILFISSKALSIFKSVFDMSPCYGKLSRGKPKEKETTENTD